LIDDGCLVREGGCPCILDPRIEMIPTLNWATLGNLMREDKPGVKNAGGIFYTPTYIVQFMARTRFGSFCAERVPKELARLRILDPACGSLRNSERSICVSMGGARHAAI
jgi:hypothetical protein